MRVYLTSIRVRGLVVLAALVASILTLPALAGASQDDEAGPALRRAREFVEVINNGADAVLEAFVNDTLGEQMRGGMPLEQHLAILRQAHESGAPYEIAEVSRDSGGEVELLLRGHDGTWRQLMVGVEAEEPHLVAGIGMRPAAAPPAPAEGDGYTDADIRAEMTDLLDELVASDRFSGAVRVVRDDEVVFEAVHGHANKDFDVPNTLDTKFNLGSMNKMFTAVAIAQLVERGALRYDAPLSEYLPDFPDPESAARIRIEHLLTHTSGLGNYFNREFMDSSRARFRTVSDLMTLAADETLQFEPGTRWSYSNTGFLVLGRVIEIVSGQDYHDYIRANVTGPAGMHSTDAYELDKVNPNLAVGYDLQQSEDGPVWHNNIFMHVIRGGPAGGGYSTVGDLVRFADALREGVLVSPETLRLLTTPKPEIGSPQYGYGFGIHADGSVGHTGGFVGINSSLAFWPDGDWTIAVMSNYSGGARPVAERAARLVSEAAR